MSKQETGRAKCKARRDRLRSSGRCIRCGDQRPIGNVSRCDHCIAKERHQTRERKSATVLLGRCVRCNGERERKSIKHCNTCSDSYRAANQLLKRDALNAYGGCLCKCCGEDRIEFLTIDHADNDGAEHRRKLMGKGNVCGTPFYRKLKQNGYPKLNLQVLCLNCNTAKGSYGYCPHEREHWLKIAQTA